MKVVFDKAVSEFIKLCGGLNFPNAIKKYTQNQKLSSYVLPNYFRFMNTQDLKAIAQLPCSSSAANLEATNVKISKMMRGVLEIEEKLACKKCSKMNTCRQALVASKAKPNVAEYVRFLYAFTQNPPKNDSTLESTARLLENAGVLVGNIEKYPVPLREFQSSDLPIQAEKVLKKKVKIPKKCVWKPKAGEEDRQRKVEKRKVRKSRTKEIEVMIRQTSTVVKKSKKKHRRISRKPAKSSSPLI